MAIRLNMALGIVAAFLAGGQLAVAADAAAHGGKGGGADAAAAAADIRPVKSDVGLAINPVAMDIDEQGNLFVIETQRYLDNGDFDNRGKQRREDDDQRIRTMADHEAVTRALYKDGDLKAKGKPLEEYLTEVKDKVWKYSDKDGDGVFETKTLFYEGFNTINSGIAAGVLARDGMVYVTAEPEVWSFKDPGGTAAAADPKMLLTGFCVKIGWYGHDLHGLVFGPDGKLYFSMGDKGWHVQTKEGTILENNNTGGVFRCNPDGTDLEVFATGLRNPQELAFDTYGNLWSGDNNCDAGDKARLVYITEGSDSGWRFSHQSMQSRGPWLREKMWELRRPIDDFTQPQWITPPIDHIGSGPSGMTFYPGLGMPDRYKNHMLLCDYRGGTGNLDSFAAEPDGAGFKMVDFHHVWERIQNTAVKVGYDGRLYISDWGAAWNLNPNGKLYALTYPDEQIKSEVKGLAALSREDFNAKSLEGLEDLLSHPDSRIRQRAQFAAVRKGEGAIATFTRATRPDRPLEMQLHAVWGLGMLARNYQAAGAVLIEQLQSAQPEVRVQAIRTLGDLRMKTAADGIAAATADGNARVRFMAIKALGKLQDSRTVALAAGMLKVNANVDAYMRDACVFALYRQGNADAVAALLQDSSAPVRLGAVLALRRFGDARIGQMLQDAEPMIVTEAVRAIYDQRIDAAMPGVVGLLGPGLSEPLRYEALLRRAIEAGLHIGDARSAELVAGFLADKGNPEPYRLVAADALLNWDAPPPREGVWGSYWPAERPTQGVARNAVAASLAKMLDGAGGEILARGYALARTYKLDLPPAALLTTVADGKSNPAVRLEAFKSLEVGPERGKAIDIALQKGNDELKIAALDALAAGDTARAATEADAMLKNGSLLVRQHAIAVLGKVPDAAAAAKIQAMADQLLAGKLAPELALDVQLAVKARVPAMGDKVAAIDTMVAASKEGPYRLTMAGGDVERGKNLFFNHAAAQCVRCHKVDKTGGDVGPDLSKIGGAKDIAYLMRAVTDPGADIAAGFGVVTVTLADRAVTGTLISDNAKEIKVRTEKSTETIQKSAIKSQTTPISGMPPMALLLQPLEIRDLIAFLHSRK